MSTYSNSFISHVKFGWIVSYISPPGAEMCENAVSQKGNLMASGISYPEINRLKLEWSLTRKFALGSLNFLWQIIRATIHSRDIQEGTKAWLLGHWAPFSGANFSILRLVLDSSSITNIMSEYGPLLARTGNAERMRRSRTNCQEDDGCHRKWRNPALGGYQDTLHVARRRAVSSARMMGRSSSTALIPFSGGKEDRWEILCWMEGCL
ncbi:hypothetical protein B0H11DRAFT_2191021 [Mycena galericulata]|nr:hypothetical protein B0H11DRAFT_2191021 [Mycena galericulata]